jgi:hypothetical protein
MEDSKSPRSGDGSDAPRDFAEVTSATVLNSHREIHQNATDSGACEPGLVERCPHFIRDLVAVSKLLIKIRFVL